MIGSMPTAPSTCLLSRSKAFLDSWRNEGEHINIVRDGKVLRGSGTCMENIRDYRKQYDHIEQLVVTTPPGNTVKHIERICDRIDSSTTICLLHDGLGVVEALDTHLFPDRSTRPRYVLGHMTHVVRHNRAYQRVFTFDWSRPGGLYLSEYRRFDKNDPFSHITLPSTASLLRTLTTVPGYAAGGSHFSSLLVKKLDRMVFHSVADPLSAVLGLRYNEILGNTPARVMADQLINEICRVIEALPEVRHTEWVNSHLRSGQLKVAFKRKLHQKGNSGNKMLKNLRDVVRTDVDFMNGYFVEKGRQLGIPCPSNELIVNMIKAKHSQTYFGDDNLIPFQLHRFPSLDGLDGGP